ncbi:MAG: plasmid replication protein, CyRepA1 family [Cyanobacteria bacterium P01_A01_bin.40]
MDRNCRFTTLLNAIQPNHFQEWQQSAVDPELIALNVKSLSGEEVYDYLLYGLPRHERRNDGRLRDRLLKRYQHLEHGGWWISGLDPYHNWERMLWGRFKPDSPRIDWQKNKPIKYESPPKVPNRVTYFDVPDSIWDKVANRYKIKRYCSPLAQRLTARTKPLSFWEWLQRHPEIPIIPTEGEKKAACLLSLGFVAIALPGIWNGRVGKKDLDERLHPDLLPLAQPGRKFTILFDYETKPKTRYQIYQATLRTGQAIEKAGCKCDVALLPGLEKGVDDFVVARGDKAETQLTSIIDDALSLKDYRQHCFPRKRGLSNKYPADIQLDTRYLSDALKFGTGSQQLTKGTIVLDSGMGTGKTQLVAELLRAYPEMRFLNLGHRVNLLKNLSKRLDTQMYSALSQAELSKTLGLSITADSLYKLQHNLQPYDCVFIDETCQYLVHLLRSKTCKDHRVEILDVLEYIIRSAKLVVLADAHMDDVTLDFFLKMRPEGEKPFIVKNSYKQPGRTVYFYEGKDNSTLVANIKIALMLGLKIMVVSDSKKFIKKLEASLKMKVRVRGKNPAPTPNQDPATTGELKVWSIHAENSGSEENVAFITDISESVKDIDVFLASPSLGTGVDITGDHFDEVFGVFHAVSQTATDCAQQLHRNRNQVPLHVWVAPRPPFGYGETNAEKIKQKMLNLNEMTAFMIRVNRETGRRGIEKDWALDAYCQIEANRNRSLNNLRDDLRSLLGEMGYNIESVAADSDADVVEELKDAAMSLDLAHAQAVTRAKDITAAEYLSRKSKDYKTPEELIECEKYRLHRDYGLPVTEELVAQDNGGRLIRQLIALEEILSPTEGELTDERTGQTYPAPPAIVAQKDLTEREAFPICMDWHNYSSKWLARHILGIPKVLSRLLAGEEFTSSDPDLIEMTKKAKAARVHLKSILGFTVPANCTPMWLLGLLLDQLGLKTDNRKKGKAGQQVRYYSLSVESLTFAIQVLEHRVQQRQERAERERQRQSEREQKQIAIKTQYGIDPPPPDISEPPQKSDTEQLEGCVDTNQNPGNNSDSAILNHKILKNFIPFYWWYQKLIQRTAIKELIHSLKTVMILFKCGVRLT